MSHLVLKAMMINNHHQLQTIPFSFLTRIEKPQEKLLSLTTLNQFNVDHETSFFTPFKPSLVIDQIQCDYQPLCHHHMKSILDCQYQPDDYIYISMQHIKYFIKNFDFQFFQLDMFNQFHLILQIKSINDKTLTVQPVMMNDKMNFLKHQEKARIDEKKFNLIYQLKNYIHCPFCVPTLCSTFLMYKKLNQPIPKSLSFVDDQYKKAFVLIKNDRIQLITLFNLSLIKWKCNNYDEYIKKMEFIGEQHQWQYFNVINIIHKLHYNTMKFYERATEQKSNWNEAKTKTSSPSWRT